MIMFILSAVVYFVIMVCAPIFISAVSIHGQRKASVCVKAKCCSNSIMVIKGATGYFVNFIYEYQGNTYLGSSSQIVSHPWEEGKVYDVYINPENPYELILQRCVPVGGYFGIAVGIFFFMIFLCEIYFQVNHYMMYGSFVVS